MPPRVLILPTALDNYRLAVRETARKWSSRAGKGVWPPASGGIDSIPEAYARVKIKKYERVGSSLFQFHKIAHQYAVYIVIDDANLRHCDCLAGADGNSRAVAGNRTIDPV